MILGGLYVYASPAMVRQYRFPRSKKMRIRRKWEMRPYNFKPITDRAMRCQNTLIVHPVVLADLHRLTRRPSEEKSLALAKVLGLQPYQLAFLNL